MGCGRAWHLSGKDLRIYRRPARGACQRFSLDHILCGQYQSCRYIYNRGQEGDPQFCGGYKGPDAFREGHAADRPAQRGDTGEAGDGALISRFISRMAVSMPTSTAREMMLWPMLSSSISLIL